MSNHGRIFYGWFILGGLSLTQIVSWGILYYAFGALITPMQAELGWSQPALAGAFSAGLFASAVAAVPVGHYIDRHGARGVMTAGSCAAVLLLFAWSRVETLTGLYIIWIGLGLTMSAVLYEPAFAVLVRWFVRRRALALSILTSVGGFASTVFVPLTAWLILQRSWRSAIVVLAAVVASTTIPVHAFVLRSRPRDIGLEADGESAHAIGGVSIAPAPATVLTRSYRGLDWILAVIFAASTLSAAAVAALVIPFLLANGHSLSFASFALALMGASQVPGRLLFTFLDRIVSGRAMAPVVFLVQAAGLVCLAGFAQSASSVIAFALLFGAGHGLTTLLRSILVADLFGMERYGLISARIAMLGQLSRAAGPVGAAWLASSLGSYRIAWGLLALGVSAGAFALFTLPHPHTTVTPSVR
jgi:MFS family permease